MTPNFILRKWQAGDEPSLATLANNHKIWVNVKDVFPHPYTLADAHDWVKFAHNQPIRKLRYRIRWQSRWRNRTAF